MPPLLVLNSTVSVQPTPPEPAVKVALTDAPSHTDARFGVFTFKLGALGCAFTVNVAALESALPQVLLNTALYLLPL